MNRVSGRCVSILVAVALGFGGFVGCASNSTTEGPTTDAAGAARHEKAAADTGVVKPGKRAAQERELTVARARLVRAKQDLADQEADGANSRARLAKELAMAEARFQTFETRDRPARMERSRLDLQGARDGLADAKEELEQLELMYKDTDLADKTKEIVIRRSKRGLERSEARLRLQQQDSETLEQRTLPLEHDKLALEVEEKRREVERDARGTEKALAEKRIGVMTAESEVARIEGELAAADGDKK